MRLKSVILILMISSSLSSSSSSSLSRTSTIKELEKAEILAENLENLKNLKNPHPKRQKTARKRRENEYSGEEEEELDDDYDEAPPPPPIQMTDEEKLVTWQNPEHPERRQGRYSGGDEEQTEFVRTEYTDQEYKKLRTYNVPMILRLVIGLLAASLPACITAFDESFGGGGRQKSTGPIPRQVECYSCMSLSYQTSWKYLQATYIYPKVFTDRCRDPNGERGMPTVMCGSVCVSLMEPDVEAGVFIGFKHIRGCLDRVLRHGFNQSALRTHRFHQNNHCRTLSRAALFNPARATDPPALGDVQLCSCYGDRCNSSRLALTPPTFWMCLLVFVHRFFLLL